MRNFVLNMLYASFIRLFDYFQMQVSLYDNLFIGLEIPTESDNGEMDLGTKLPTMKREENKKKHSLCEKVRNKFTTKLSRRNKIVDHFWHLLASVPR